MSTVVERILQSTADSEAGGSVSGASTLAGPDALTPLDQAAVQQAAQQAAQQQRAQQQGLGPVGGGILGNAAALATVGAAGGSGTAAKQSVFSVATVAAGRGTAAGAAGPLTGKLPLPPVFAKGQRQAHQQQAAGQQEADGADTPAAGLHRRLWSGAAAGAPPPQEVADALQRLQVGDAQAEPAQQQQQGQPLDSADDPAGALLLGQLEASAGGDAGVGAALAPRAAVACSMLKAATAATLATVVEQDALAAEASAQSRHEAAEVGGKGARGAAVVAWPEVAPAAATLVVHAACRRTGAAH